MLPGFHIFHEGQMIAFGLIFLRLIAFLVAWPVLGASQVPVSIKILLALILSVGVFPIVKFENADLIKISEEIIFFSVREILIGLILGFLIRMFFFAVSIGGELISTSLGLSNAQVFNPLSGAQSNIVEQFHVYVASMIFLVLNGHHFFIQGVYQSFELIPLTDFSFKVEGIKNLSFYFADILEIGIKIAIPVIVAILLTNICLGIIGRAVPQVNVFVTSMQTTIIIGLVVLLISLPLFVHEMDGVLQKVAGEFTKTMRTL